MGIRMLGLCVFFALFANCSEASEVKLRIMQTADLHMYLSDYDFFEDTQKSSFGLVRTASLIKQARREVPNTILIDNGDLIQGNPMGDYQFDAYQTSGKLQVHPLTQIMTHLAYDVGNIGNHEFNFGLAYLQDLVASLPFPYVCANVYKLEDDQPLFKPFVMLEPQVVDADGSKHSLKVAVIGVVPPQIMNWDKNHLHDKVRVTDMRDAVKLYLPQVKQAGADLVIVVAHAGIEPSEQEQMEENAVVGITKIEGVNAVFAGHHHRVFPGPDYAHIPNADLERGTINGIPVVMPGFWGSHLGLIDFHLKQDGDAWQVEKFEVVNRPISERDGATVKALVEADAEVAALLTDSLQKTRTWLDEPIGTLRNPVQSYFSLVADSGVIQIVQDAQRWYVEDLVRGTELAYFPILSAAAPFRAGYPDSKAYIDIPAGKVSLKEMAEIYIYPNTLKVLKLTGAEVREWLERAAAMYAQVTPKTEAPQALINKAFAHYNFDMIDGVTFQIDASQPARYDAEGNLVNPDHHRIENLKWRKVSVYDDQEFLVVTNSYRAYGGGNFPGAKAENVVIDAPDSVRDVLRRYVRAHKDGIRVEVDHNWGLKPLQEVKLVFEGSPSEAALKASKQLGQVTPAEGKTDEGFQRYHLSWMKWVVFPNQQRNNMGSRHEP